MCRFVRFLNKHFCAVKLKALLTYCKRDIYKILYILSQKSQCYKRNGKSASVRPSRYICTFEKLESHSAIASCDS